MLVPAILGFRAIHNWPRKAIAHQGDKEESQLMARRSTCRSFFKSALDAFEVVLNFFQDLLKEEHPPQLA